MANTDQREIAETAFRRDLNRGEINVDLKQEHAPRGGGQKPVSLASIALGAGRKTR